MMYVRVLDRYMIYIYTLRSQDWHHDDVDRITELHFAWMLCSTPVPKSQRRNSPKVPSG